MRHFLLALALLAPTASMAAPRSPSSVVVFPGSFNARGAWAPSTAYAANDVVSYQGSAYVVTAPYTSGSSFSSPNLTLLVQGGAAGAAGTSGANGTSVTSTAVNTAGHLIVTLSNGVVQDAGLVSGGTTETGTGLSGDAGVLQFIMQDKSTAALMAVDCSAISGITCPTTGTTITFTGPAGALSGNQVLSAFTGATLGGALDGAGNLLLPNTAFTGGLFEAIGTKGDGTLTITRSSSQPISNGILAVFRSDSTGANSYFFDLNGGPIYLVKNVSGAGTRVGSVTTSATSWRVATVAIAGSTFTLSLDGMSLGSVSDTTFAGPGYIGVLTGDNAAGSTVSGVSFH